MRLRDLLPDLDAKMTVLNGEIPPRSALVGEKLVLIHFWSVSCKTCGRGIENVHSLQKEYKDSLAVISIHVPRKEEDRNIDTVKQFIDKHKFNMPVAIDQDHQTIEQFGARIIPAFYLFDQAGKLRYVQSGKSSTTLLTKRIERLIANGYNS